MLQDSLAIDSLPEVFNVIYLMANEDSVSSKLNLVKRAYDGVQLGTATFTQWQGWAGNGSTGYINTTYNPATDSIPYTLNSASIGVYNRTGGIENKAVVGSVVSGNEKYENLV